MRRFRKIIKENINKLLEWVVITVLFFIFWSATSILSQNILLDDNQQLYLFSCSAQVIATMFALSFTAYIFSEEILKHKKDSETIFAEPVDIIRSQNFFDVVFMSIILVVALILDLIATCSINENEIEFINSLDLINLISVLSILEICLILKFSLNMINPDRIPREINKLSDKYGKKLKSTDVNKSIGDVAEYLLFYNRLVQTITALVSAMGLSDYTNSKKTYESANTSNTHYWKKQTTFQKIKALQDARIIPEAIADRLIFINKTRNDKVHGDQPIKIYEEEISEIKLLSVALLNIYDLFCRTKSADGEQIQKYLKEINALISKHD